MLLVNPERLLWRFSDRTIESSLHGRVFDAFWLCLETSTWSCMIKCISFIALAGIIWFLDVQILTP